jgi:hypothetical protein
MAIFKQPPQFIEAITSLEIQVQLKNRGLKPEGFKFEYDPQMGALKCWIWQVSERGFTKAGHGGRTWEDAFKDYDHHMKAHVA